MTNIVYSVCNFLQRGTLKAFADLTVSGRENVPRAGKLIIVANHQSNIDPPLLAPVIPRRLRFLAKDGLFGNPIASWFLRSWGAHPLRREAADVRALRWALSLLGGGGALVLFPEGTRHPGALGEAQNGVAQLALRAKAPLLPIGITGTETLGSVFRVFKPSAKLTVTIGAPFHLPPVDGRPTEQALRAVSDMIMGRIADLLPERYRGAHATSVSAARNS